jgi:ADP-ribose pyrophosphatase
MLRLSPPKLRRWRRLRREVVAAYRIFEVCRVELEDGAGQPRGDAFTLQGRDWCNVVAVTPDDQIVLVWQYRFGTDALSLEIPGGVIDAGEEPARAAERELLEETGYAAEQFDLLLAIEPNPAIQNNRCFTFVARGAHPKGTTGFDPQEELETTLLPAARLPDLLDGGQVTHALVQGALETYWRRRTASELESPPSNGGATMRLVMDLEESQRRKVLDLARRLRSGLTLEDIANPHDFPELADPDWQYEDGKLAAIRGVLAAIRARRPG